MEFLFTLLLGVGGVLATATGLLFTYAVCYDLCRTNMAPHFDHPLKLRIIHWGCIMSLTLGQVFQILGLCSQIAFIRFLMNFKRPNLDPSLFSKDLDFSGVPVRVYQPKAPSSGLRRGFVLFHGGAGMVGSIDFYEDISSKIAKECDLVFVSVGYRLSPEHLFPTQYKDCLTATIHFMQNAELYGVDPSQIIIGGDSVGGNFATVVAQLLVERPDLPKLRAQVLISACMQAMDFNLPSYQQNATFPVLFRENIVRFGLMYFKKDLSLMENFLQGSHVPNEMRLKYGKWISPDNIPERFKCRGYKPTPLAPYEPDVYRHLPEILQTTFSSLLAEDSVFQQLPETLIISCEYDVLRDDSLLYKKRLEDSGVKVTWFHAENGFHGAINLFDVGIWSFPSGVEILDNIIDFVNGL
ncbi:arylacetamide deacetylase-like 4 [Tiliqua scincoides]|uniref:arylacetamide deacetylase-like 4 n=1 Tax=Tiliqua scincoides TaxID=71010 RepID=UPI003461902A